MDSHNVFFFLGGGGGDLEGNTFSLGVSHKLSLVDLLCVNSDESTTSLSKVSNVLL